MLELARVQCERSFGVVAVMVAANGWMVVRFQAPWLVRSPVL